MLMMKKFFALMFELTYVPIGFTIKQIHILDIYYFAKSLVFALVKYLVLIR